MIFTGQAVFYAVRPCRRARRAKSLISSGNHIAVCVLRDARNCP